MIRLLRAIRIWWQCMPLEQELAGAQQDRADWIGMGCSPLSKAVRMVDEEIAILRARIAKIRAS